MGSSQVFFSHVSRLLSILSLKRKRWDQFLTLKDSLMQRGVILTGFTLCSGGCGEVEMINPLLNRWLGLSTIVLQIWVVTRNNFLVHMLLSWKFHSYFQVVYGWFVLGSSKKNVIREFLITKHHLRTYFLIILSFIRGGGWRHINWNFHCWYSSSSLCIIVVHGSTKFVVFWILRRLSVYIFWILYFTFMG